MSKVRRMRRVRGRWQAAAGPHALVLMYHRLATPLTDPWRLSVSPAHFAEHLEVLRSLGQCLSFVGLGRALEGARPPSRALSVTFDDGYRDNLVSALPLLEAAGVPATVFVTSGTIGQVREFWWDTLARVFLPIRDLPPMLTLTVGGILSAWHMERPLGPQGSGAPGKPAVSDQRVVRRRHRVLHEVWRTLLPLQPDEIERHTDAIAAWAGHDRGAAVADQAMNHAELSRLAKSDLIEIGGHTVYHPPLTLVAPDRASHEIAAGRSALREWTGRDITSFAYPFGMHSPATVAMVRDAGFRHACTVIEGITWPATDLFRVPRLQVLDWTGEELEREIVSFIGGIKGQNASSRKAAA